MGFTLGRMEVSAANSLRLDLALPFLVQCGDADSKSYVCGILIWQSILSDVLMLWYVDEGCLFYQSSLRAYKIGPARRVLRWQSCTRPRKSTNATYSMMKTEASKAAWSPPCYSGVSGWYLYQIIYPANHSENFHSQTEAPSTWAAHTSY